jgi:hypothetical protein
MATKVYRTGKKGAKFGPWKEEYKPVRAQFKEYLQDKGPYTWKMKNSEKWSDPPVNLEQIMRKCDQLAPRMHEDNAFWAKTKKGVVYIMDSGKEEAVQIPKPPSGISPSIARAHNLTFTKTAQLDKDDKDSLRVVTMGYTVCKLISGTRVPSQHCSGPPTPTGGNAMDWVVRRSNGSVDIDATDKVVAHLRSNGFPEVLWRGIPGHYPNHAHTSGNPKRSGWPACL